MLVDFVGGSGPCSERFFSRYAGFPLSQKPVFPDSNSIKRVSPIITVPCWHSALQWHSDKVIYFYASLVTLLSSEPEVQYVALRNINLIVQKRYCIVYFHLFLSLFSLSWNLSSFVISSWVVVWSLGQISSKMRWKCSLWSTMIQFMSNWRSLTSWSDWQTSKTLLKYWQS